MSDMIEENYDCTGLFDSHAHYFDRRFENETEGADKILCDKVFASGIEGVINIGTNNVTSRLCIDQAKKHPKMYATVGIHPEDVVGIENSFHRELEGIFLLVGDPKVRLENKIVALGEIGLDYHCEGFDKEVQQRYFESQLCLAQELDMPVVIHDRDAHGDCFETVTRYKKVRGVFHSFSGSAEMAAELVKRGWYISFSGVVTFKNARKALEVAASIPMERILIETDAPYLAPHPHRGKINHSGLMYLTAEKIAEIKNLSIGEVAHSTRENVRNLFGI